MKPTADGIVETTAQGPRLRFERRLAHPVARVWAALTDPEQLHHWWGDAELELVEGGAFSLRWRNTDDGGNAPVLTGAVTRVEPPHLLVLTADWGMTGSDEPGMATTLVWELTAHGDATVLRFTNSFDLPDACLMTAAGWHLHLDALAARLEGGSVDIVHPEVVWKPIHSAYVERYGS